MVENIPVKAGDVGPISGSGRSPGEGNGKPWERLLNEYRVSEVAEKHYIALQADSLLSEPPLKGPKMPIIMR